jgi:hypothetical protein
VLFLAGAARAEEPSRAEARPGSEAQAQPKPPPINLFLGGAGTLDALLKSLEEPDFVLLKGEEYRRLLERLARAAGTPTQGPAAVVDAVAVEGLIGTSRADLTADFGITLGAPGPLWVPIRLDDQTVTGASEAGRELPLRVAGGSWEVELQGPGPHRVRVAFKVLTRATVEGQRIDFAIPEAASTRFAWEVAERVAEASTASGELVDLEALPPPLPAQGSGPGTGTARTRLSAHLTPRARLDVSWRAEAGPEAQLPPLLTMQGEIAIDIDSGSLRTRSTWAVHAVRGTTRSLELRLDPADEVLELELDGQPVPAGIERVEGAQVLTLVLGEPLGPGPPRSLVMTTRRTIAPAASTVIAFGGFPLTNANEQSGAIGIAQAGNLWVGGTMGRGLRRIDPRTELPPDLRARPATSLAYVFADQPFELGLRIEPSPPLVRTEARTTVTLDTTQARVDTWLTYQPAHGRLFDLAIALPEVLELESVGPKEVVDAAQRDASTSTSNSTSAAGGARVVRVRLTPQAQEDDEFTVHLTARQAVNPAQPVDLALFQPLDATSGGGRIAVLTGRNLTVDVRAGDARPGAGAGAGTGAFRPVVQEPPADWPWPAERAAGGSGAPAALWLRQDGHPAVLPLEIDVHPRTLTARTSLRVEVERRALAIEQETECTVHFGMLDAVDVEVPASAQGRWEPEGSEVLRRSELGTSPQGGLLTRLVLGKEVRDKVRLRFRIRLPVVPVLESGRPATLEVPWIRVVGARPMPIPVGLASEPGVELAPPSSGWSRAGDDEVTSLAGDAEHPPRFGLLSDAADPPPLRLRVTAHPLEALPGVLASRLWLRTVQGVDYELQTTAVYVVETHESAFSVAFPPGATLVRARVGGRVFSRVETLPGSAGYRLPLPEPTGTGPVLVELDYTVGAGQASGGWRAPRLLDGGFVQQTLWEVRVPWGRAVVGVPRGWTDENAWAWDRYYFRRRARPSATALAGWAGGGRAEAATAESGDDPAGGDVQRYLFGQSGPPGDLHIVIASRGLMVGVCSGTILLLGALLILVRRPTLRLAWAAVLVLLLAAATLVEPSVVLLVVQSALIGVVLTLLTALMQYLVHRRRHVPVFGETSTRSGTVTPGSSLNLTVGVGSDDSTQIRVRPVSSTAEHLGTSPLSPPIGRAPTGASPGWTDPHG